MKNYTKKDIITNLDSNIKAKKSLGQNFLKDSVILEKIVKSIPYEVARRVSSGEVRLIEVGIGLGDLTKGLVKSFALLAYEIDDRLIQNAEFIFFKEIESKRLEIEKIDALHAKKGGGYLYDSEYFLVSNLPYYIATNIILQAIRDEKCSGFLVMIQREVARKFCASIGSKEFCALSVIARLNGEIKHLFDVSKECFTPSPKVESSVICFMREPKKSSVYKATKNIESIIKAAFSAPRKRLFSNLLGYFKDSKILAKIFENLGLDSNIRAHQVSEVSYLHLLEQMQKFGAEI